MNFFLKRGDHIGGTADAAGLKKLFTKQGKEA
jgi:hypothetical protein